MRTFAALVVLLLSLTACGSGAARDVARDAAPGGADPRPTEVPAAPGAVRSRTLVTVMDDGGGAPEVCLGAVAESYPPQCGGPEARGWTWDDLGADMYEQQGDVRWGQYAVGGTWDGATLTVTSAVPAALYDAAATPEPRLPAPAVELSPAELRAVADDVGRLPGATGAFVDGDHVLVEVTYDDGSMQAWADATHGRGVVVVSGQLVDG